MTDKPDTAANTPDNTDSPAESTGVIAVAADGTATAPTEPAAAKPIKADQANADQANAAPAAAAESHPQPAASAASSPTGATMPESKPAVAAAAPVAPVIIKQSSGKGVALGALVLSLLALGASGFLFVQGQNVLKTQELSLDQKINEAGVGQSKNAVLLENNLVQLKTLAEQVDVLQAQGKTFDTQLAASSRAYQELVKSRADWLVDETEASLNMAAQQLLISGNVPVAVGVLENLESRLTRFDQPQLVPIKQAISQDLAALKSKPYLDVASASLRLNRLETAVASLPLAADAALQPGATQPLPPVSADAPWWQRAWQNSVQSLQGMVEVRRLNSNDSMLMSPEQVYFVRENLRLKMMDARLALMQRSGEVYMSDLNSAEAAVKQYFDGTSAATQSWLKELAQLKGLEVQGGQDANVLAASLAAVRQYQQQARADAASALPDLGASAPAAAASSPPAPAEASAPAAQPANPAATSAPKAGGRTL